NGTSFSGVAGRGIPQASATWRYPFISSSGLSSVMLEPVVEFAATAGGGNISRIPNEDSQLPEFNDSNLFAADRFPGLDRVESGAGVSYGLRGQAQFSDNYLDWLLGQHYRIANDSQFPFSNDPNTRLSDYVGRVGLTYQPLTFTYRFRFDKDTLTATRDEIDAVYNMYPLTLSTSYLLLRSDPILQSREVISGGSELHLTREWSWSVNGSRDLLLGQMNTAYTGLTFKNECISVTTLVGKDYTNLLDIKPSFTFWFRVALKNLE
ncbi:MAG: LPS assembly protein LptD, partial [Pseudomonadota bacterium]|nr:LPS assembly protein LptD [Pseudomonadota bacterium]